MKEIPVASLHVPWNNSGFQLFLAQYMILWYNLCTLFVIYELLETSKESSML